MNYFQQVSSDQALFKILRRCVALVSLGVMLVVGMLVGMGCQTQDSQMVCGGLPGAGCPNGMYCAFDEGTCSVADGAGVCMTIPAVCTKVFSPVCGCDGVTYGNDCEAAMAGVSLASRSECETMVCGTIAGIACPVGMYCAFDEGRCNVADDAGLCATMPEICIELFAPVCGCDGVTYGNACMAAMAGVSLASQGECPAP